MPLADLSKGERTPRPEHVELLSTLRRHPALRRALQMTTMPTMADVQQLHDQFSLEADVLYRLAQNPENFLDANAWQEAKTKVNALNPERFPFNVVTPPQPEPSGVTFTFVGSPNFWPGELRPGECVAIVQHTAVGTRAGIRSTFGNRASQVSSTGSIALTGDVDLFVGWYDAAWANGIVEDGALLALIALFDGYNPNMRTVSFEREDGGNPKLPVPDKQVRGAVAAYRRAMEAHPEIWVLTGHNAISPRSRTCPESAWLDSGLLSELATELNLTYMEYA